MSVGKTLGGVVITYLGLGLAVVASHFGMARLHTPACTGEVSRPLSERGVLTNLVTWLPDLVTHVAQGPMTFADFLRGGYECRPAVASVDLSRLDRSTRLLLGDLGGGAEPPRGSGMGGATTRSLASGNGPSQLKITSGAVAADDTRAGLVGTWEPDADLGLPAGSNHVTYLADGIFINPFRNIALVGFWDATADSIVMTPTAIRRLDTGDLVPELREMFGHIDWDTRGVSRIRWLAPDRYTEEGPHPTRRRVARVHDVRAVHAAVVTTLIIDTWSNGLGREMTFDPDGTYREGNTTGRYGIDGETGALTLGSTSARSVRWDGRQAFELDGERWQRSN